MTGQQTVCTATQCFETHEAAGLGVEAISVNGAVPTALVVGMTAAVGILLALAARHEQARADASKPKEHAPSVRQGHLD